MADQALLLCDRSAKGSPQQQLRPTMHAWWARSSGGPYLGSLLGSDASAPWHIQRFVLLRNVLLLLLLLLLLLQLLLLLLLLLHGICFLGQAQLLHLTTSSKHNDCS
jgi:hypothetical protein